MREGVKFSKKCNRRQVKINGMGRNLRQNFKCQVKYLIIFYKTYRKISLALPKKKSTSFLYSVALVWKKEEGASLKNHQHFEEQHILIQI